MFYQFKQLIKYLIVIAIILNGCSTKTEKPSLGVSGGYGTYSPTVERSKAKEISEITNLYTQKAYKKIHDKLEGYKNAKSDEFIKDLMREDFGNISFIFSMSAIYMKNKPLFEYIYEIARIHEGEKRTRDKLDIFNEVKNNNWGKLVDAITCYLNKKQKELCQQQMNDETLKKLFDEVL